MKGDTVRREWTVTLTSSVSPSKIRIVEDRACDGPLAHDQKRQSNEDFYITSDRGCGLHVTVLERRPNVPADWLVKTLIMIHDGKGWVQLPM